ncbi:MAG: GTP-binding protein [Candidatus Helarchaeota archaeon]
MKEEGWLYKLIIVGDPAVGKTSLLLRSIGNKFSEEYLSTIGVDFYIKPITIKNQEIKLQIWDTGGEEKYSRLRSGYYVGAVGAIIVYDVTNPKSFENVPKWIADVQKYCPGIPMLIAENKIDLPRVIPQELVNRQLHQLNLPYFQTSAKENSNVNELFQYFSEMIIKLSILPSKPEILRTLSIEEISLNYERCTDYARSCIMEKGYDRALNALEKAFIYSTELNFQAGIDWIQETIVFLSRLMYGDSAQLIFQRDQDTGVLNPIIKINGLRQKLIMPPKPISMSEKEPKTEVPMEVFSVLNLIRDKIVFGISLNNLITQLRNSKNFILQRYKPHSILTDIDELIAELDTYSQREKEKSISKPVWNKIYAKIHEWKTRLREDV